MQDCGSADHMLCEPWRTVLTEALRAGKANPWLEHVWIPVKIKLRTSGGTRGSVLPAAPKQLLSKPGATGDPLFGLRLESSTEATARLALVCVSAVPHGHSIRSPGGLLRDSRWPDGGHHLASHSRYVPSFDTLSGGCSPVCCHCNLQSSLLLSN